MMNADARVVMVSAEQVEGSAERSALTMPTKTKQAEGWLQVVSMQVLVYLYTCSCTTVRYMSNISYLPHIVVYKYIQLSVLHYI